VSNIHPSGLEPERAAARLAWLVREALRLRLTGVALKEAMPKEVVGGGCIIGLP
jgi:ethanolamine ammonia-lyase small subunit